MGFAIEIIAYLAHLIHLLRQLHRFHGQFVQCPQLLVFSAAAQSTPDVLQFAFISCPAANAFLQLLLTLGQFAPQFTVLLCNALTFVLKEVDLSNQLLMLDLNIVGLLYFSIQGIRIGAVLVLELPLCFHRGLVVPSDALNLQVFLLCHPLDYFLLFANTAQLTAYYCLLLLVSRLDYLSFSSQSLEIACQTLNLLLLRIFFLFVFFHNQISLLFHFPKHFLKLTLKTFFFLLRFSACCLKLLFQSAHFFSLSPQFSRQSLIFFCHFLYLCLFLFQYYSHCVFVSFHPILYIFQTIFKIPLECLCLLIHCLCRFIFGVTDYCIFFAVDQEIHMNKFFVEGTSEDRIIILKNSCSCLEIMRNREVFLLQRLQLSAYYFSQFLYLIRLFPSLYYTFFLQRFEITVQLDYPLILSLQFILKRYYFFILIEDHSLVLFNSSVRFPLLHISSFFIKSVLHLDLLDGIVDLKVPSLFLLVVRAQLLILFLQVCHQFVLLLQLHLKSIQLVLPTATIQGQCHFSILQLELQSRHLLLQLTNRCCECILLSSFFLAQLCQFFYLSQQDLILLPCFLNPAFLLPQQSLVLISILFQFDIHLLNIIIILLGFLEKPLVLCKLVPCLLVIHFKDIVILLVNLQSGDQLLAVLIKLAVFLLGSRQSSLVFLQPCSEGLVSAVVVFAHALKLLQLVFHEEHDLIALTDLLLTSGAGQIVFICKLRSHSLEVPCCILLHLHHLLLQQLLKIGLAFPETHLVQTFKLQLFLLFALPQFIYPSLMVLEQSGHFSLHLQRGLFTLLSSHCFFCLQALVVHLSDDRFVRFYLLLVLFPLCLEPPLCLLLRVLQQCLQLFDVALRLTQFELVLGHLLNLPLRLLMPILQVLHQSSQLVVLLTHSLCPIPALLQILPHFPQFFLHPRIFLLRSSQLLTGTTVGLFQGLPFSGEIFLQILLGIPEFIDFALQLFIFELEIGYLRAQFFENDFTFVRDYL